MNRLRSGWFWRTKYKWQSVPKDQAFPLKSNSTSSRVLPRSNLKRFLVGVLNWLKYISETLCQGGSDKICSLLGLLSMTKILPLVLEAWVPYERCRFNSSLVSSAAAAKCSWGGQFFFHGWDFCPISGTDPCILDVACEKIAWSWSLLFEDIEYRFDWWWTGNGRL